MATKIHLKPNLSTAVEAFKYLDKDIALRLHKDEIGNLAAMLTQCIDWCCDVPDLELEYILLKETKQLLLKKYGIISNNANIVLSCSQARTLFVWLNEVAFEHPLEKSFSYDIVGRIYKQII